MEIGEHGSGALHVSLGHGDSFEQVSGDMENVRPSFIRQLHDTGQTREARFRHLGLSVTQ